RTRGRASSSSAGCRRASCYSSRVKEENVEIPGAGDGLLLRPDGGGPARRVIHLTDIHGVRPAHRDMAARLVELGCTVLLPNVFHRTGKAPMFDFPFVMGEERTMKRMGEITRPLQPDVMERDASAYIDFLGGGPVAVVGYCFTGQMALRAAAA